MNIQKHIAESRYQIDLKGRLEWNEKEIEKAARSLGSCLKDIHDKELWRAGKYDTFEDYAVIRWGFSRQRAYQIIGAEDCRMMLADKAREEGNAEIEKAALEMNDAQASQFKDVPPDKATEVFKESEKGKGKRTASKIKKAKARIIETESIANNGPNSKQNTIPTFVTASGDPVFEEPNQPQLCPHCGQPMP